MIKEITYVEKFVDTKIFIHTEDKLSDNVTLKIVMMLVACVVKDESKFYSQLFLEEAFF